MTTVETIRDNYERIAEQLSRETLIDFIIATNRRGVIETQEADNSELRGMFVNVIMESLKDYI